ncbi:tetratricopeptide repeat protein [Pleurocapsales cyanobacterium LEGE 06147]|nr:tetratricopeptide repeat protein [Pleurocapsales cyanobacterium LEGE 06147]
MAKSVAFKPLGLVLQRAGLVSPEQIKIALRDQTRLPNRRIGEILALRGWIKPETVSFFAEKWPKLIQQKQKQPLGQYLKAAALLNEQQIETILKEQKVTGLKFGILAVFQGLIEQATLDFFLEELKIIGADDSSVDELFELQTPQSEELRFISNYLINNQKCDPVVLLKLYEQIWQQGQVPATDSIEEGELLESGLIVRDEDRVKIAKPIYQSAFNESWIEQELARLQPYSQIRLKLFGLDSIASSPYKVLTEVRSWTGNQPLLTQKLYRLIRDRQSYIPKGQEAAIIEELVQTCIIDNWQNQVLGEHLNELSARLLHNERCSPVKLLMVYKKIWQQKEMRANDSIEQAQLLEIGLIEKRQGKMSVANRIYESVFNQSWIDEHLDALTLTFLPRVTKDEAQTEVLQKDELQQLSPPTEPKTKKNAFGKAVPLSIPILGLLVLGGIFLFSFNVWTNNRETRLFARGNKLLQQKEYDRALKTYDQLLSINNNYYQAWTNRGYALAGLEQYEQMLQSCSSATVIEARAEYGWNCQGEALYYLERYEQALAAFERAIEIDFQEPIFWINKGLSLAQLQQSQASLAALNKAIDLLENTQAVHGIDAVKDELKVAYYHKGQIFFKQQQYLAALATYEQALGYGQNYLSAQWGKGITLQKLERHGEARAEFNRILKQTNLLPQQQAVTWFYLGSNFCKTGSTSAAINAFEQALQLKPDYEAAKAAITRCSAN